MQLFWYSSTEFLVENFQRRLFDGIPLGIQRKVGVGVVLAGSLLCLPGSPQLLVVSFAPVAAVIFAGSLFCQLVLCVLQPQHRAGGLFLKIDSYSMIFMMLEITTQGVFYGTGRTVPPALVSITGNVLRIPLALLLGHWGWGIAGVWWAISMSSILKGCVLFGWLVLRRHVLLTGSTLRPRSGLLS